MEFQAYLTEDEFNQADEAAQGHYTRRDDGNYWLNVVEREGVALENISGLRSTIEAVRGERDTAQKALKAFGDVDPKGIKDILAKAKRFDELDPEAEAGKLKQQFETWKEEFSKSQAQEWQGQVEQIQQELSETESQLRSELVESKATQAMLDPEIKGIPGVLIPVILTMTDVVKENGRMRCRILNRSTGHERIGKDGGPLTFKELFQEMRKDRQYAGCFEGANTGGTGSQEEGGPGPSGAPNKPRKEWTDEQKAKFIHDKGLDAYFRIPLE